MRYVDALEREVRLKSAPRRVVSLVPSLTEALFAFGLGDSVVGVTNSCVEPRDAVAGKTKVGGTKTLDVPRVLALEPDLVVASAEENRKEDIQALVREGLKVYVTLPTTVAGALDLLDQLAAMTSGGRGGGARGGPPGAGWRGGGRRWRRCRPPTTGGLPCARSVLSGGTPG